MKLGTYIIRRLLLLVPVLIGVSLITFALGFLIPADPVHAWAGQHATAADIQAIKQELGLDQPWYVQYGRYLTRLATLNFGESPSEGFRPISQDLAIRFPATFELAMYSMLFAVFMGIPTGIVSAVKRDKLPDHLSRIFALVGTSIPVFWLAIMLLLVFYGTLEIGFFAPGYRVSTEEMQNIVQGGPTGLYTIDALLKGHPEIALDAFGHLILPAFCLSYISMALITRMMRSSMLEVLGQDYIKAARAKGLSEKVVIRKHAMRNALIPTTTVVGLSFGGLLGGAVLTETVFAYPGMGIWSTRMLLSFDFTGIMAVTVITAFIYVITNLVVDVIYAYLDPRIRLE